MKAGELSIARHRPIILVGKAASGKNYLRDYMRDYADERVEVSFTTRPMRKGERNGDQYWFISEEEWKVYDKNNCFFEKISFCGWHYGTTNASWQNNTVFIMTPVGLLQALRDKMKRPIVVYLDIDPALRRKRLMERGDVDSVERRLAADEADFKGFAESGVVNLHVKSRRFSISMVTEMAQSLRMSSYYAQKVTYEEPYEETEL